ncbi:MAG: hypothetical protein HY313_00865 [Acidobacteria bacterium]|nr:hypothetical protein [Acidobacteriota bacterium]
MQQSPLRFCILFHTGRNDAGQPLPNHRWWDSRPEADKEAMKLQFMLTTAQRTMGCRYSVSPIHPGYKPLWRPVIKPA